MSENQNHALMFAFYLNRMVGSGDIELFEKNKAIMVLSPSASQCFVSGRDVNGQPFLGYPVELQPFFPAIDWLEASLCKKEGILILEARDPQTYELIMGFGIRMRRARTSVFYSEGNDERVPPLNLKVFMQDKNNPGRLLFPDENELDGINLKSIESIAEFGGTQEAEYAQRALDRTGAESSFSFVDMP